MVIRNRLQATRLIMVMLAVVFLYSACTPESVPFVAVREADFRVGPVDLPLDDTGKEKILFFLLKGGDNSVRDFVDPDAQKAYAGLLQLLSDPGSLAPDKFRKNGDNGKISETLEQWFEPPIIYSLIDATRNRPPAIPPLSVKDKNGKYWWIFYMPEKVEEGENLKIARVLVTLAPSKKMEQYGKVK